MEPTIFHLALAADWAAAREGRQPYDISTLGVGLAEQGFVHCSFADQVQRIADLVYAGRSDVLLLTIDPALLTSPVRVEEADGDAFPHVYGPLDLDAVRDVRALEPGTDGRLDAAPSPIA